MKFKFRFAEQIVGLFVLISLILVCVALILIGINKRWLRDDLVYTSSFPSATGLRSGMSVTLRGFKIGELQTIELDDDNMIGVSFVIYEEYINRVVGNSVIELQANPLGLGAQIAFYPGIEKGDSLQEGSFIHSTATAEGRRLIKEGLVDKDSSGDIIVKILNDADEMVLSLNSLLITLDETLLGYNPGPVGEILDSLGKVIPGVSAVVEDVQVETLPEVGAILEDIKKITQSFALLARELETVEGIVPKMLDPKGSVATFLDDDNKLFNQVYGILDELQNSMKEVRELMEYLNGLSPEISSLVEGTGATIDEAEKVLQGLKNNPLLRGGIEEETPQDSVSTSIRDGEF
ncbi:MlaD family protein [Spirochaeta isovalerica]|uniref:Phospholipid/cholesterol/gamma-HCH transport system substrate-binding protein n=1 Tax=Spirochaeta isovalerica TaxID=150 RepID=A0A841R0Z3_9SPIO|nr:MlaD family protein [Spirochaeta isovalerica]MBB6478624.1 phospholipid/cholesterol/gamma-HCH transport system substrate-binding protein [Spirochaeta isovalerica]